MGKKIVIGLLVVFGAIVSTVSASPRAVAIIHNLDTASGVIIYRASGFAETSPFLYKGDRITGADLSQLEIEYFPRAYQIHNGDNEIIVAFETSNFESLVTSVIDFIGFNQHEQEVSYGVTKGSSNMVAEQFPRPGYSATLLFEQKVNFGWGSMNAKKLYIYDSKGQAIYEQNIEGLASMNIIPKSIGLFEGQVYRWKVEGSVETYTFRVLDHSLAKVIEKDMFQIDDAAGNADDIRLKKAAYLQLMSDEYDDRIDLYWLSYQLLQDIHTQDKHTAETVEQLKRRFKKHLDDQM